MTRPTLDGLTAGADFDGRGVTFTEKDLSTVLQAVGREFGTARFDNAKFLGTANFDGVRFAEASFVGAQFDGNTIFADAQFDRNADFSGAAFGAPAWLGPLVAKRLDLVGARFTAHADIHVNADQVQGNQVRFDDTALLRVGNARISLEGAVFNAPSSIAGSGMYPELVSLRDSNVGNLTITDVDLRWCQFAGAHRLDQLRIEGHCPLNRPPKGWRWTRRQVLAEEYLRRWAGDRPVAEVIEEARLAALYRSLRKSFEDSKNEAGAGDFYYGEMEARRHSTITSRAERLILGVYWLLSGYGQRAARALTALVVLIATVTMLLAWWGQPGDEAAQIAVGAVVFRDDGKDLTDAGEWTVMAARFLGPVLLALAVLAIRARVKR